MGKDWLAELQIIMAKLRAPGGCPWDIEQDHQSLKKYLVEECSEVLDAIDHEGPEELKDELGDVLMNVYFHAQIASENKQFDIHDVAQNISEKMVRRHPHVFGDQNAANAADVDKIWQEEKEKEKGKKNSALDGIPGHLPSLRKAQTMQKKAAKLGFDWPDWRGSFDKIQEELAELREELEARTSPQRMEEEFGDLLFSMVNFARVFKFDADDALRQANHKFDSRFRHVEKCVKDSNKDWPDYPLEELDEFWDDAKKQEK